MQHPDWPAFIAAIVAEPADDTPRLVAADFLEEHGEPDRAALIRIQIELARRDASGLNDEPETGELRKKERALLGPKSEKPQWWAAEECPELLRPDPRGRLRFEGTERLTWRRGFVEWVTCPAAEWLRHGVAVRSRNPVREVMLTECDRTPRDAWYAGFDALRGLRRVDVVYHVSAAGDYTAMTVAAEQMARWLRPWLPGTQVECAF
jgi:uncharacterized protein (TIGR02996 family)